jgi:hypothetical protein
MLIQVSKTFSIAECANEMIRSSRFQTDVQAGVSFLERSKTLV